MLQGHSEHLKADLLFLASLCPSLPPIDESGRVQMEPPSYHQGVNGPSGGGSDANRAFSPSNVPGGAVQQQQQAPASPQQGSGAPAPARAGKRQYAANQTAAYGYDQAGGGGGQQYGAQPGYSAQDGQGQAPGQQQQFFSPAFGDPSLQQQQGYPQQQQSGVIGPGASVHGRQYSQQMYPQQGQGQGQAPAFAGQGGYQQPGVAGLSNQFGQMGIGGQQRSVRTVAACAAQTLLSGS